MANDTAPSDIIKTALDILASPDREVELVLTTCTRYGTLTGVSALGETPSLMIQNYRAEVDEDYIVKRTFVGIDEIIGISLA